MGVYLFWPETNGRHLEEVDEIFIKSKGIFDPVSISRNLPRRRELGNDEAGKEAGVKEEGESVEHV